MSAPPTTRIERFLTTLDALSRELDRRDALLTELRRPGGQFTDAQLEVMRAEVDQIFARCRSVRERLTSRLLAAAQDDLALLPFVEQLHQIPPLVPSNARLTVLRLRALVDQVLATPAPQRPAQPPANPKGLLTAKQVAAEIGLSDKTVYRLARDGRIPYVRIQGSLRFRAADVKAWLDAKTFRPKRP